jgi:hypothetical protein
VAVEVHVTGRITAGHLPNFAEAVERYKAYAAEHGYAVPQVLLGLSGPMNSICLVYRYDDLSEYDTHEFRAMTDRRYGELAGAMDFADGTITYTVYRRL